MWLDTPSSGVTLSAHASTVPGEPHGVTLKPPRTGFNNLNEESSYVKNDTRGTTGLVRAQPKKLARLGFLVQLGFTSWTRIVFPGMCRNNLDPSYVLRLELVQAETKTARQLGGLFLLAWNC
jgi:hypothetical protein